MFIQKKSKWNIFCRIIESGSDPSKKGFQLSFTTHDFQNFVPPNGDVTDFNLCAELGLNYSKLKAGIYIDAFARCLISETPTGIYLHGVSYDWEKLKILIAKIVSSAGMEPKILHARNIPLHQVITGWTQAMLDLQKR